MKIVAPDTFSTGNVIWQEAPGQLTMTVVCKATYALAPLFSDLAEEREDVVERDNHWDDDPRRSLYAPGDLAPMKTHPELVLVGSAYAPRGEPVHSLIARVVVGEVDKSIEVFGPRSIAIDGQLHEGPRWTQMPLRYERAAGGVSSSNPVGIDRDAADVYGRRTLPNLQSPGVPAAEHAESVAPIGFGPIAPTWPERIAKLRDRANTWFTSRLSEEPIGSDFDATFFQSAPLDQRVSELRADEHIILENLHPSHPRLVTHLPGERPRAQVEMPGMPAWDLVLVADTLWIDTQRAICTLTWRGQIPLSHRDEDGIVRISLERPDREVRYSDTEQEPAKEALASMPIVGDSASESLDFENTNVEAPEGTTSKPALPFHATRNAASANRSLDRTSSKPVGSTASDAWDASWPIGSPPAEPAWMNRSSMSGIAASPLGAVPLDSASSRGIAPPAAASSSLRENRGLAEAAYAGVLAASNAAAYTPSTIGVKPNTSSANAVAFTSSSKPRDIIELLWHDPQKVARLRASLDWRALFKAPAPSVSPAESDTDGARQAAEAKHAAERADVTAIVTRGATTPDVEGALATAYDDEGAWEPPLVLVAGELEMLLDEVKTLEAMLGAAAPLASGDKKLKEVVDLATEVMKTPLGASPGVATGFVTRLREAWMKANRMLAPEYLDVHTRALLLERRDYQKRELWGEGYLRASAFIAHEASGVPTYLPEPLAKRLPLFARFPVRLIAEAFAQQEQLETHPVALRVVALARVVPPRVRTR
jgi:hypothetical protein